MGQNRIIPGRQIQQGQIWEAADGSGQSVKICETKKYGDGEHDYSVIYYPVEDPSVDFNTDSFTFQCRYCIPVEVLCEAWVVKVVPGMYAKSSKYWGDLVPLKNAKLFPTPGQAKCLITRMSKMHHRKELWKDAKVVKMICKEVEE